MLFEIVSETAGTGAFIASDLNIFPRDRSVGEMNPGVATVHPCSAKAGAPQSNCAVALPGLGIPIGAANRHSNCRRTLPLPFAQKRICLRWNERAHYLWRYGAFKICPKIVGSIEEIRPKLAARMTDAQVPNQ